MESATARRPWEDENGSQERDTSLIGVQLFRYVLFDNYINNYEQCSPLSSPLPPATMPIVSDDLKLHIPFLWLDGSTVIEISQSLAISKSLIYKTLKHWRMHQMI